MCLSVSLCECSKSQHSRRSLGTLWISPTVEKSSSSRGVSLLLIRYGFVSAQSNGLLNLPPTFTGENHNGDNGAYEGGEVSPADGTRIVYRWGPRFLNLYVFRPWEIISCLPRRSSRSPHNLAIKNANEVQ